MRPGQNKRMRGRSNRKGPNPLTRTYESNGPDVKIRGTAQHIAEKYLQLARDAHSSGDPVGAENYLQHAEHYFRLIAAAQTAQQQAHMGYARSSEELDESDEDDDLGAAPDRFASPFERATQNTSFQAPQQNGGPMGYGGQPQPYLDRPNFASEGNERQGERSDRQERNNDRGLNPVGDRQDRQPRPERRFGAQGERPSGDRQHSQGRNRFRDQQSRNDPSPSGQEQPRVEFDAMNSVLPSFITAPTRIPAASAAPSATDPSSPPQAGSRMDALSAPAASSAQPSEFDGGPDGGGDENRFHLRPRRRRRPRPDTALESGDAPPLAETNSTD